MTVFADDSRNTIRVVAIEVVDVDSNQIHCVGADGGRFAIPIPISNGFYRIPKVGEYWMIRRENLTTWLFEGVMEPEVLYGNVFPQEGDSVINTEGNLVVSANNVLIGNDPIGAPAYEEFEVEGNETDTLTLQSSPIPSSVQVFNNGLLIALSGIIIGEQSLLFSTPLAAGRVSVYYMKSPQT